MHSCDLILYKLDMFMVKYISGCSWLVCVAGFVALPVCLAIITYDVNSDGVVKRIPFDLMAHV